MRLVGCLISSQYNMLLLLEPLSFTKMIHQRVSEHIFCKKLGLGEESEESSCMLLMTHSRIQVQQVFTQSWWFNNLSCRLETISIFVQEGGQQTVKQSELWPIVLFFSLDSVL